ncbi:uncharacterized protein EI97DRAFT_36381 [Westerdykella ornata]|uniref:Uncharacterized protein n=1 Tax=Westerdykella ornata TaxID=318751 RepID=A0A6A6JI65_WESOR|nr:uncharacterized protein EI97DRAFT_36381 [Westerdykella ornata]KAF2276340.1 hypothetical protein EI97DRAFT_36381 [Westerdykella ornata]
MSSRRCQSSSPLQPSTAIQQPAHSSQIPQFGADSFAQTLYKVPAYRYSHSLTFLELFSPSAEKKIIRAFSKLRGRSWHAELPRMSDFQKPGTSTGGPENGWWEFAHDLREMGLGWAEEQFGPPPIVQGPATDAVGSQSELESATDEAAKGSDTEPDSEMETIAKQYLRAKSGFRHAQRFRDTTSEAGSGGIPRVREAKSHIARISASGDALFASDQPHAGSDKGEDTKEDSEAEQIAQRYPQRPSPPRARRSSAADFGKVEEYGPIDMMRIRRRGRIAPPLPKEGWPSYDSQAEVEYPTLPSLPSFPSQHQPPASPPVPSRPVPNVAPQPNLPPAQAPTPGGYLATYRPRQPNDTLFHRGSAGVNPDGAHARPPFKKRSMHAKNGMGGVLRHHRIVSGSFGSFETEKPSRFNDRPYRLFAERRQKKEEKKAGPEQMEG